MFLQPFQISRKSLVADIVAGDYRTAEVFRKYGIGYCCGGKWPMEIACEMQDINPVMLQAELELAVRTNQVSNHVDFAECDTEFILDYIINVHHRYLKKSLNTTQEMLADFANEHVKKFTYLNELEIQFDSLVQKLRDAVQQEEEVLFPHTSLSTCKKHKEPYAALLIKTLRKPIEETMFSSNNSIEEIILSIRNLAGGYEPPEKVCISHKVVLAKLKELDNDLMQHLYLEQSVLFPRAMAIEKELLNV
ncbi:MAG: DUF542 domain-containing protein [Chitinophagaceae bacterium]|nr:DUF542 domain-containing protein [Chitinophagaceae bacterium]